jgi:hypothetical protein
MPLHRVMYVIIPSYPLTDFLFERMHAIEDIKLIEHPMRRRRFGGLLRALDVYALPWWRRSFYFDKSYTEQLARIRPEDSVLFFAIENRKDLQIIRKFISARRQFVWLWNPIEVFRGDGLSQLFYRFWIRRSGMQAFTFNPADARDDGIRLINQVYRQAELAGASGQGDETLLHDVYFLGIDKGRLPALQALRIELERAGLTTHFRVIADKRRHYSDEDRNQLATEWLPYKENLRIVRDSRALLELLQSTQNGPTIRSMEAAFFNKKLITNNQAMRQSPLYHPSRIFILGQDDMATLGDFIGSPLEPVPGSVLQAHDIEHWIRQFED